jgi:hypothetical protein
MVVCEKKPYPTQEQARLALAHVLAKAKSARQPIRVYPCDRCPAWHLTSKGVSGKQPPWDSDPNWVRPARDARG